MSLNGPRRVILYYSCKYASVFEQDERFDVELVELSAPSYAPLSPLAIITQR